MTRFWEKKRVLITGHTGFKGSWLSIRLREEGADLLGVGLKSRHALDNFSVSGLESKVTTAYQDIRDFEGLSRIFRDFKPEIVFHLAAQSLVATSYDRPKETFETNTMGTLHVLEAIRRCPAVKSAVLITSDKCYQNVERVLGYREEDRLGGDDPYSASKAAAELVIQSYRQCYFNDGRPLIASCRAGNVVGGGDWSEHRIVPDCFRSLFAGNPVVIRNPKATRPWQFVLEPLRGYMMLAEKLFDGQRKFSAAWNFGPSLEKAYTVQEVTDAILKDWGGGKVMIEPNPLFHESNLLQLDCAKAGRELGWKPRLTFEESIRWTTQWYKALRADPKKEMYDFCVRQIRDYRGTETE